MRFLKLYATLILLYAIAATVTLYTSAEIFIKIFYGEDFNFSAELVQGLSFCVVPMTLARLLGHVMNAVGSFNYAAYTTAVGAMVSIFANIALIGNHQIWAPIYATFLAETIVLLILMFLFFQNNKFLKNH